MTLLHYGRFIMLLCILSQFRFVINYKKDGNLSSHAVTELPLICSYFESGPTMDGLWPIKTMKMDANYIWFSWTCGERNALFEIVQVIKEECIDILLMQESYNPKGKSIGFGSVCKSLRANTSVMASANPDDRDY